VVQTRVILLDMAAPDVKLVIVRTMTVIIVMLVVASEASDAGYRLNTFLTKHRLRDF
jgi:hypothetical protein